MKNLASSYVILAKLRLEEIILAKLRLEEIEYVVLYSINQRGAAESDKVGIVRHGGPRTTNRGKALRGTGTSHYKSR